MNAQTLGSVAFIAALLLGYGAMSRRDNDADAIAQAAPLFNGYYMKDAVIIETNKDGSPRVQFTAKSVAQNPRDNGVSLTAVRIDYLTAARNTDGRAIAATTPSHWILSAEQGYRATRSDIVTLSGNVVARTASDTDRGAAIFKTASLDFDTKQQLARTDEAVDITMGQHWIAGTGLAVDLPNERMRLASQGRLRLAANQPEAPVDSTKLSLPTIFEFDSLDFRDNTLRLTNVRSKVEPFVRADEAVATDTDLTNNRFTLTGNVRFDLPNRGGLQAHSTVVTVRDSRIVHASATGQPVNFEHQRKPRANETGTDMARGRARIIDYDVPANTLLFKGDVWFSTGRFEWRGDEFQYNLLDGSGNTRSRSTTTIQPRDRKVTTEP